MPRRNKEINNFLLCFSFLWLYHDSSQLPVSLNVNIDTPKTCYLMQEIILKELHELSDQSLINELQEIERDFYHYDNTERLRATEKLDDIFTKIAKISDIWEYYEKRLKNWLYKLKNKDGVFFKVRYDYC